MHDNKMNKTELRAIWSLSLILSLRMLGMFMVLPVLTTYGIALKYANEWLIGCAIGIYGIMQSIFQILFGIISDRIGRKPLIIIGLIIFSLGSFVSALSHSIFGVIFGRAIQGSGAISSVIMALISDFVREQNRTKAMAFIGVSFGITFAFSIVLGPIITSLIGLRGLFFFITIIALIGIILTIYIVPFHHIIQYNPDYQSKTIFNGLKVVLKNSQLLKLNFCIFCLHSILMFIFIAVPSMLVKSGLQLNGQWKIYFFTIINSFFVSIPLIIYTEVKHHIKLAFLISIIMIFITEISLKLANNHLWIIYIGIQLFFISFNVLEAILPSMVIKESPKKYKGTVMGVYSTSQFLGSAFGSILSGGLYKLRGGDFLFLSSFLLTLIWYIVSITLREPPYVSILRITVSKKIALDIDLKNRLYSLLGVSEVILIPEESIIYIKIDTKQTSRAIIEKAISI